MESELSPDQDKLSPPVPIKTYQWEDLRRSRDAGGYPWTHLLKVPLEGEITAEDIIRETTPRRSMSREFSRSRTRSPFDEDVQRILNLDSSPGSSRRHTDEGEDEGIQVPKFSEEVSCESEDVLIPAKAYIIKRPDSQASSHLSACSEKSSKVSPKSILKRRTPEQQYIVQETSKTKCCHPLVNKIKHLADKTLLKLEGKENEKSPSAKRKKKDEVQEIRQLKASPGAVRRQNFSAIKLGDSDEMSKTDTPTPRKKKEHIYEDIDTSNQAERSVQYSEDVQYMDKEEDDNKTNLDKENINLIEKKSIASQDPSLVDDASSLKEQEHIMEQLHKIKDTQREAVLLDDELDPDEPNVEEVFQDQLDETRIQSESPNVTITEIVDEYLETNEEEAIIIPIETSPTPSPREVERKRTGSESNINDWSKPSSDHEYEIIGKPAREIVYGASSSYNKPSIERTDDELSNTSIGKSKQDQFEMDADDNIDDIVKAEALQRDIEERYFLNTPSSISRTECEISTSQVDSSALENLPLKRDRRSKNTEKGDNKLQQRFKEGTGKLKSQAGKLKTKFQNMNMPERPKMNFPDRSKFKLPDRPKFTLPDRPKFTLPDKRKFSLPDRPKFKKINITEKLTFGDRKKFTMPERPKMPDFPKFKMPERPKINFPSLGRRRDGEPSSTIKRDDGVEFETKTYPRLFSRKKKAGIPQASSSPTLNRDDTPPPTFTFTRVKKTTKTTSYVPETSEQPREYGNVHDNHSNFDSFVDNHNNFETTYDFDNVETGYLETKPSLTENSNISSTPDISSNKEKYSHINEINNDEFFVRPRGISRENIQVREYLSDEIRQAFKIPKNLLASMGSNSGLHDDTMYDNEAEADPELLDDECEPVRYSTEDLNDKDDGYYTFPPVRPSRSKRKKKDTEANIQYIDDSTNASIHFSDVDLGLTSEYCGETTDNHIILNDVNEYQLQFSRATDLSSINEYANDDIIEYPGNVSVQPQTLPMPPKRKKKIREPKHSSLHDLKNGSSSQLWDQPRQQTEDVIVYRIEHEYIVPESDPGTEHSPLPPRRNRSRGSQGTSLGDDDRTSHGAESLTLDTHLAQTEDIERPRQESPGYATVDKNTRRSASKTPPVRRRKSRSTERKYYTVGSNKPMMPDRPPRKKSTTSLVTLDTYQKLSVSADLTQYVEIDEPQSTDFHKDLSSGAIINKMKDRPLPPPPRPPRGSKRDKFKKNTESEHVGRSMPEISSDYQRDQQTAFSDTAEIEVSTQTDPLPDDVDFELGMDDNIDVSMTSSLRDIIDEDSILGRDAAKVKSSDSLQISRPTSRTEKSLKFTDSKISELAKANVGRTSPTVILVERRVSSPTRINQREEILTEASLTVQRIDIDESQISDIPLLPVSTVGTRDVSKAKNSIPPSDNQAIERVNDTNRDVQLDNLITQRLQVQNLDVSRLNVSELQASKILVSEVEGMTLQVNELDTKSGHISVSGIDFSQSVIDEIVKKFSEITTNQASASQTRDVNDYPRPESRSEQTQTDHQSDVGSARASSRVRHGSEQPVLQPPNIEHSVGDTPPQRPPPPDLTPLLYSYLHDAAMPQTSFYTSRPLRERPFTEFHEAQHHTGPPPNRRAKRKPAATYSDSSSEHDRRRPSPRRMPTPAKSHETTVTEAGVQFLRVCQNSVSRTIRNMFNSFMSYISGTEDKKDMQMALVIFLVLIAGLIMFGLSDSRTVHHHHWEFFNPPDTDTKP